MPNSHREDETQQFRRTCVGGVNRALMERTLYSTKSTNSLAAVWFSYCLAVFRNTSPTVSGTYNQHDLFRLQKQF